jgi:hypothetical protein
MSDEQVHNDPLPDIKRPRLREWRGNGRKRTLGGRWDKARIAEVLEESRTKKFTLADLAKIVYGTNTQTYRDDVRKHLSNQRTYMLGLMKPFITEYGPRGIIISVKFYDKDIAADRDALDAELSRLVARNELSQDRYVKLCTVLSLSDVAPSV